MMWHIKATRIALVVAAACLNTTVAQRGAGCGDCADEECCSSAGGCEWVAKTENDSQLRRRLVPPILLKCNDTPENCEANCGDQGCEWTEGSLSGGGAACVDGNGIACVALTTTPAAGECVEKVGPK